MSSRGPYVLRKRRIWGSAPTEVRSPAHCCREVWMEAKSLTPFPLPLISPLGLTGHVTKVYQGSKTVTFVLDFTISFLHKSPKLLIRNLENKGKQNNYKWISCKNFPLVPCRNKHSDLQSFRQFPCTYTLWILMLHVCLSMPISTQLHHCFSKMVPHYVYNKC